LAGVEERLRTDASVEMLVNSAGAANFAPLAGFDAAAAQTQIALNITATTRLTAAVLPGLTARGHGTIVNVSSALAYYILPVSAVYSGTKSYVATFTQALQQELDGSGVTAQLVIPGAMRTGFWAGSGFDLSAFPDEAVMDAEPAVDAALAGLDAGEPVTIPSLPDVADWHSFEQARGTLAGGVSRSVVAARYLA
ncbi:MAG: SDR family NAD(P)-dependent oxidoreductase, partial [Actinocrinis sp.]